MLQLSKKCLHFSKTLGGGQADTHSTPFPLTYGCDPIYVKAKLNPWFDPDISTNPALKEGKEKIGRTNNEKSDFWAKYTCISKS